VRQYFPIGTNLSVHSDVHVAAVVHELSTRPRKGLGYRTPHARFRAEIRAGSFALAWPAGGPSLLRIDQPLTSITCSVAP